ncbi:MAG: amidohydrolase family protein [Alphaproteobacteria bacterium]|nr:amidohydrolase family protein [Alphaproteobacteria bacterium]MBU0863328.1 amidohydrolase family protein [Alphaproteobacteria bacterium]
MKFKKRLVAIGVGGAWAMIAQPAMAQRTASPVSEDRTVPAKEVALTLDEGSWMSVDVSPDGRLIAFDLLNDIYVMPADGGDAVPVHVGSATQRNPVFSPDGQSIAFISDENGADNIWVSALDGSAARAVTSEVEDMMAAPAWAADGRSLYAVKMAMPFADIRSSEINRYDIATGAETRVVATPASGKDVQEPRASGPNGDVWFTERVGGKHFVFVNTAEGIFSIKRRDGRTGAVQAAIGGLGGATTPQPSPDGKRVAFIRRVGAKTVLFGYDVATRAQRPIYADLDRDLQADYVQHDQYFPSFDWFPDNRHVAIWGKGKLLKVDMASGKATPIPFRVTARHSVKQVLRVKQDVAPDMVEAKALQQQAVSPDGNQVIFRALGYLYTKNLADRDARPIRLTRDTATAEHDPAWSRDGRTIAYVSWHDERGSELRVRTAGTDADRVIARSRGMLRSPSFAPDGKRVAFHLLAPDPSFGGYREVPGIYEARLDVAGTAPDTMAMSRDDRLLIRGAVGLIGFSDDGQNLVYRAAPDFEADRAERVMTAPHGGRGEGKEIAYAPTADSGDIVVSPDGRWVGFTHDRQAYLARLPSSTDAASITKEMAGARKLTDVGGYELRWSADSKKLSWLIGNELHSALAAAPDQRSVATLRVAEKAAVPEGRIALVGARIVPMTDDDRIIEQGTILIEGNRIVAVGDMARIAIPAGTQRFDVSGKTILPGLFDAHGHIDCCYAAGVMPRNQPTRIAALAFGVTTNFDPYSNELTSYESGEMTQVGGLIGPRWLSSGHVAYGRSGKADRVYEPLSTLDLARHYTARKQAIGGQIIKSYKLTTRAQRQYLLRAAREKDIMVDAEGASHIADNIGMILDGHTNLEHNIPVANYYDDLKQLFAASGISHTPTLIVTFGELFGENYIYQTSQSWDHPKVVRFIPDVNGYYNPIAAIGDASPLVRGTHTLHYADALYDVGWRAVGKSIAQLDQMGVPINVGSHGQASGIAMHWEMRLLAEAGMPIMRVLRGATINPARSFGYDHALGSLEPGKLADLIVLDKNPLDAIGNTDSVKYTMINGRMFDALTMDEVAPLAKKRGRFFWELDPQGAVDWKSVWEKGQ